MQRCKRTTKHGNLLSFLGSYKPRASSKTIHSSKRTTKIEKYTKYMLIHYRKLTTLRERDLRVSCVSECKRIVVGKLGRSTTFFPVSGNTCCAMTELLRLIRTNATFIQMSHSGLHWWKWKKIVIENAEKQNENAPSIRPSNLEKVKNSLNFISENGHIQAKHHFFNYGTLPRSGELQEAKNKHLKWLNIDQILRQSISKISSRKGGPLRFRHHCAIGS